MAEKRLADILNNWPWGISVADMLGFDTRERKIERLVERGATEGEREAARQALARLRAPSVQGKQVSG